MWKIIHLPTATVLRQFGRLRNKAHAQEFIDRYYFYYRTTDMKIITAQSKRNVPVGGVVVNLDRCEFEPVEIGEHGLENNPSTNTT